MLKIKQQNNRGEIIVPKGVRYISDWSEYSLNDFQFPHILDKKIPGCGYTEYCIGNNIDLILCSPRRMLLENKEQQHTNEVFYFKNELESDLEYDKDLTKQKNPTKENIEITPEDKRKLILEHLKNQLRDYVLKSRVSGKPCKILVTYDSFRLVKDFLVESDIFQDFYTVIDEFQSVLVDSKFKSSTELEFLQALQGVKRVCYVSATPMIDRYLNEIPEFANLPYYELNWVEEDPLRAIKPDLRVRTTQSILSTAREIISPYLRKEYEMCNYIDKLGRAKQIYSKEAVLYVNSVNNIISIVKNLLLEPEQVNILCADTPENRKRIKTKLGARYHIGSIPLKGETRKMITLCTRTVYLGADFYSDNARSFILSDANIDSLAVDISLDLPQILGRQRLNENPWKNRAEFYYKTLNTKNKITKEDFDLEVEKKTQKTNDLLLSYSTTPTEQAKLTLAEKYEADAKNSNYKRDYVAVNTHGGNTLIPVINHLVRIAEQRAFDIQQIDYKDRFTVFNTLLDSGIIGEELSTKVQDFIKAFEEFNNFSDKMRFLCESSITSEERCVILDQIPLTYKNFYLTLGVDRCRANGYNITPIRKEYNDLLMDKTDLESRIESEFKAGNKYPMSDIKEKLREIYNQVGYNKSPKATDLEKWFEIKKCTINFENKRTNGFEILAKK